MTNFFDYIRANSSFAKLAFDDLLFVEYKCPIKENKLAIWTESNYLVYVVSGKKIWSTNDVSFELKEGDSMFVAKGGHYIEQILTKEFCVLIFFFSDEFLEDVLDEAQYKKKRVSETVQKFIPIDVNEPLKIYFQSMASFLSQRPIPSRQLLSLKFRELVVQLLNYQDKPELFGFFDSVKSSPEKKFRQLIENNLQFNLGIDEYARITNMSQSTFKRFFKQVFKSAPGQYILNYRLSFASLLLKNSSKSIQEIAYESGFESAAHFTRMFNKKYKISPSKFRSHD